MGKKSQEEYEAKQHEDDFLKAMEEVSGCIIFIVDETKSLYVVCNTNTGVCMLTTVKLAVSAVWCHYIH